jgi:iduronate 2-sulfatase
VSRRSKIHSLLCVATGLHACWVWKGSRSPADRDACHHACLRRPRPFPSPLTVALAFALTYSAQSAPAPSSLPSPPGARPNILLIVADDLNADLGAFGVAAARTPNLDRLIARGVKFDRAYCQFPLCSPSRESFLSGRRPETTGAIAQGRMVRDAQPDAAYLPAYFRQHGWFTGAYGKIFHKNDPRSWDRYEEANPISPQEIAALKARSATRERGENSPEWYALDCDDADTGDGIVARGVVALMREHAHSNRPFFLGAGFRKPHLPWTAPKKYFDLFPRDAIPPLKEPAMRDIPPLALQTDLFGTKPPADPRAAVAAYYACVAFIDAQIGLLTAELDALKLWDNTIVVFMSDHGFHLGDHGGLWAKLTNFERSARVPFAIVAPRSPHAGRTTRGIAENLDLYPTLVELAGLPRPVWLDGRSLAPLLAHPAAQWDHAAFTTTIHEGIIGRSVRTDRWRYTEWGDGVAAELYDQTADNGNYRNLAADPAHAADIAALKKLLAQNPRATDIPADAQTPRKLKPAKRS